MLRIVAVFALLVLAGFTWSIWRRERARREVATATAEYARQRLRLQDDFRAAANVSGKPRGLRWKATEFQDTLLPARDRSNGALIGLVGAIITFEAVEGGGMEEVKAVGNLRAGTAVLTWTGHDWTTAGHAVFNLEPHQTLEHYRESLAAVGA